MIQQRKRVLAFNLFLIDLALTAGSFFLAYGARSSFELEGHTVMPMGIYLWLLWLILPIWGVLLPAFGVYSARFLSLRDQLVQLSKAIGLAWIVAAALLFFFDQEATSRLIAVFTLVINYALLVSYRVVLFAHRVKYLYNMVIPRVHLAGLDASKNYRIKEINVKVNDKPCYLDGKVVSGKLLMEAGLNIPLEKDYASRVFELTAE